MKINEHYKIMLSTILAALIPMLSFAYSIASAGSSEDDGGKKTKEIMKYVDTQMNSLVEENQVKGVVVSIVADEETALSKGYGYADEKNNIKADAVSTIFKIGSVSKTFVALAAMQLAEQGKLDMNSPISRYLEPDFPQFRYPVTMLNLLTHTAGFEEKYSSVDIPLEIETADEMIPLNEFVRGYLPYQAFKPGEVSAYSNYGISLAGYVIERISGKSFYEYTEDRIFKPLKMTNTTFKPVPSGIISKAYGPEGTEKIDVMESSYPSGSVSTTANNMAGYMKFLLNAEDQSILSSTGKMELFKKQFAMSNELPGHGYVWERHEINGHLFYSHSGGTANFNATIAIYPEQKLGIFISCNQSGAFELAEYYFTAAEMLYGKDRQEEAYTGENSRDISGWYIPARSVFKGSDKFADLIMGLLTGYPKKITGNTKDGFAIGANRLIAVGEDAYKDTHMGYIKFTEKNGNLYYTPKQSYISFIRVPWIYGNTWQIFVVLFFIAVGAIGFAISVIATIAALIRKKGKEAILTNLPLAAVFLLFASMIGRFLYHIDYMTKVFGDLNNTAGLPGVIISFKIIAVLIAVSVLGGLVSTIYIWHKKKGIFRQLFYSVWSLASVLLVTWLIQLNLIG